MTVHADQPTPLSNASPIASDRSVLVVIVNYRSAALTIKCLASLVEEMTAFPNGRVIVVDNASEDDSVESIATAISTHEWQDWVELLPSDVNGGYAYGNNLALVQAFKQNQRPDYVYLLNPDTIIRPGAMRELMAFMEANPTVGITGSRLEDLDQTPQYSAFRFPTLGSEIDQGLKLGIVTKLLSRWVTILPMTDQPCPADWVAGASMMVRTEVFEDVGLMDDDYFLYYEEVDFCLQAYRNSWSCWYVPASRVVHFVGQSTGVTTPTEALKRLPAYYLESRRRYFTKNHGQLYRFLVDTAYLIAILLWQLRRLVQRKPPANPQSLWTDIFRYSVWQRVIGRKGVEIAPPVAKTPPLPSVPTVSVEESIKSLGFWTLIKEDLQAHGRDWMRPGFQAIAVSRYGVWRMTIKFRLFRLPFNLLYNFLFTFICNVYGIELPYTVKLGRRVVLEHQHGIVIHGKCVIGNDCIIRQGTTLGNRYTEKPYDAPILGERVNVGAGAKVLGKLVLGDDVNIGANAVVLTDVPAGKTAVGIPAKVRG